VCSISESLVEQERSVADSSEADSQHHIAAGVVRIDRLAEDGTWKIPTRLHSPFVL